MTNQVLIVEDSPDNMIIVSFILQRMGYEVVEAWTGIEGYQQVLDILPSLIITDYHLPGLNGVELVKKIRDTESIAHIPVIAMTADIYARPELMQAGCDAYITKPVRKGILLRTINQVLSAQAV